MTEASVNRFCTNCCNFANILSVTMSPNGKHIWEYLRVEKTLQHNFGWRQSAQKQEVGGKTNRARELIYPENRSMALTAVSTSR